MHRCAALGTSHPSIGCFGQLLVYKKNRFRATCNVSRTPWRNETKKISSIHEHTEGASDIVKCRVLEKIPGQLEASFLIFLTLGSIKQSNTQSVAMAGDENVEESLSRVSGSTHSITFKSSGSTHPFNFKSSDSTRAFRPLCLQALVPSPGPCTFRPCRAPWALMPSGPRAFRPSCLLQVLISSLSWSSLPHMLFICLLYLLVLYHFTHTVTNPSGGLSAPFISGRAIGFSRCAPPGTSKHPS